MTISPPIELETVACSHCGSRSTRPLYESRDRLHGLPGSYTVVRCRQCSLVYLNPRPTMSSLTAYYPEDYSCYDYAPQMPEPPQIPSPMNAVNLNKRRAWSLSRINLAHSVRRQWFDYPPKPGEGFYQTNPILAPLVKLLCYPLSRSLDLLPYDRSGSLLDVGCGAGRTLDRFKQEGWVTTGVEMNPMVAARVRERGHHVFCGELHAAHFSSESFDAVIIEHTLEHVSDPATLLKEMHRILRPGGTLKVAVPNFGGILARTFGRHWYMLDVPRHLYQFTPRTLHSLLRGSGFKVAKWRTKSYAEHLLYSWQYARHRQRGRAYGVEPYSRALERGLRPFCRFVDILRMGNELQVWGIREWSRERNA